jgi:hypothetical protein
MKILNEIYRYGVDKGLAPEQVTAELIEVFKKHDAEFAPKAQQLIDAGYPPRLVRKVAAGRHPNSP